jgi:probable HAF family extracellular repeat protein
MSKSTHGFRFKKLPLLIAALGIASLASVAPAAPPMVEITDLGTLGGDYSFAYAINDNDQIVGRSWMPSGPSHSFLYTNGQMIDLYPFNSQDIGTAGPTGINNLGQIVSGEMMGGVYYPALYDHQTEALTILGSLGGVTSYGFNGVALAINNFGQVAGYSYINDTRPHAFVYDNGAMHDIDCLPGDTNFCVSYAFDINDQGQVVGSSSGHAFVYSHGRMSDISPLGSQQSYAYAINTHGQVVGYYYKSNGVVRAFLYNGENVADIGPEENPETVACDINDHGQVVGSTYILRDNVCRYCDHYEIRAFLYENGTYTDLTDILPPNSGWHLIEACGINNKGNIVGYGSIHGQRHAYMLRLHPTTKSALTGRASVATASDIR